MRIWAIIPFLAVSMSTTVAWAQLAAGTYTSLDGTMEHHFQSSGIVRDPPGTSLGVFRMGAGICWLNRDDGSKKPGDLILYVGEVQCCLQVEDISDKVALTRVWVQGTGFGYQMCKNQVFVRSGD